MIFLQLFPLPLAELLPSLALEGLLSTQGIMVMLLVAYAGAMWLFLTSAPKVYTLMVSDLEIARRFYEEMLDLPVADVPLHYYYNYEQTLAATSVDPLYASSAGLASSAAKSFNDSNGLWYQVKKNTQLHVIAGASFGEKNRQRHVCFDKSCLEMLLRRTHVRGLRYKIKQERPLHFLVKDAENRTIEMVEVAN